MEITELIKETQADFIVDLYEIRANIQMPRFSSKDLGNADEFFRYNWLNTIIANLTDKYKLRYSDIEQALYKRAKETKKMQMQQDQMFTNLPNFKSDF